MMVQEFTLEEAHPISGLASLGSSGAAMGNAERDLHRWLDIDTSAQLPTSLVKIRIANPCGEGLVEVDHAVLMPTIVTREAYEHGPSVFGRCIIGPRGDDALHEFWSNSARSEWAKVHPHLRGEQAWRTTVPIWLHGDMARIYKAISKRRCSNYLYSTNSVPD